MTKEQIEFYESLPADEKQYLQMAALKASAIKLTDLCVLLGLHLNSSKNQIRICLQTAENMGLLERNTNGWASTLEYDASTSFMIHVFPMMGDFQKAWFKIKDQRQFYSSTLKTIIRDFLFSLLHHPKDFTTYELQLWRYNEYAQVAELAEILDHSAYAEVLKQVDDRFVLYWFQNKANTIILDLYPLTNLLELSKKVDGMLPKGKTKALPVSLCNANLQKGQFADSFSGDDVLGAELIGISRLSQSDVEGALTAFNVGLKLKRVDERGALFPNLHISVLYYIVALLRSDPKKSMPIIQKMANAAQKDNLSVAARIFIPVYYNAINVQNKDAASNQLVQQLMDSDCHNTARLLAACSFFLAESKPPKDFMPVFSQVIRQAIDSQFYVLALEAAYAYSTWPSKDGDELLELAQRQLKYTPVLAGIQRQADWEKSINSLLATFSGRQATVSDKDVRVVYFINVDRKTIQPVLQTKSKNGWSKGRNIAMKTLYEGKANGMTEQDYRVAKTIRYQSGSYYHAEEITFSEGTFKELVGHPYLFLNGSEDVSVELLEGKPNVQVTKTPKGYTLSSNLTVDPDERIVIQKETNTRYKVFSLTNQQMMIMQIIQKQNILVPEAGKEKLVQLLGSFSAHMEVHSDLLADAGTQAKIREVKADSRIRVQLLPLGSGLKAELFSKPFGAHPPYCKPGLGGKVLIANEKGEQLQVKRDLKQETEFASQLMDDIQSLESLNVSNDLMSFDDPLDSLYLLDILAAHQDKSIVEWPEGVRYKIRGTANFNNLNLNLKSGTNWFELQGELKVDENTVLTLQQLLNLTENSHDRFIELGKGEFLALSKELKKQLDELRSFATQGKKGVQLNKFASVSMDDFFGQVENLKTDKAWKEFRKRLDQVKENEASIPSNLQAELRPYQEEGFRWMARLAEWDGGACLADDMGLGKTIQTLAILLHRAKLGPALVVCPVSVLGNWLKEAERFAPSLNMKTLSMGHASREQTMQELEAGDVLVTSYGLLQSEEQLFCEQEFATVVLDEAHTIKNYATKTSKSTMQLKASFRLALTGTPLQNHLGEIWNLFNFVNPGLLGTLPHFTDTFIKPSDEGARKRLKKLITPFILRRTKSAVLDELPPKTEIIKKISMSAEEMAFYEALRRQAIQNIEAENSKPGANQLQVMAEITKLRQASCNPLLVDPNISIPSSKLHTFLEIVDDLIDNKHRVLVFSQFVTHLSIVRQALDKKGIKYQYLDGSMSIPQREQSVKKFQQGEGDLFLISLKAGGLGLNLTAADYVIHMDPWWNPAIEDQASDRAHRIGQTRPVTIYRLVAENTIEEKIIQLHNTKRDLAESLLEGSDQSARLSINELIDLIKTN